MLDDGIWGDNVAFPFLECIFSLEVFVGSRYSLSSRWALGSLGETAMGNFVGYSLGLVLLIHWKHLGLEHLGGYGKLVFCQNLVMLIHWIENLLDNKENWCRFLRLWVEQKIFMVETTREIFVEWHPYFYEKIPNSFSSIPLSTWN